MDPHDPKSGRYQGFPEPGQVPPSHDPREPFSHHEHTHNNDHKSHGQARMPPPPSSSTSEAKPKPRWFSFSSKPPTGDAGSESRFVRTVKFIGRQSRNYFAIVGITSTIGFFAISRAVKAIRKERVPVPTQPGGTILDFDVSQFKFEESEVQEASAFALQQFESAGGPFRGKKKPLPLRRAISLLDRASDDPRVSGLLFRCDDEAELMSLGFAGVQELRDAVDRFRAKNKPAFYHSTSLGGNAAGNSASTAYYMATSFSKIYSQPGTVFMLPGYAASGLFFKKTLEMIGVRPTVLARNEYKTAANSLIYERFTEPEKEATSKLLSNMMEQVVDAVVTKRNLTTEVVRQVFDEALFDSTRALSLGLLDELIYRDEITGRIEKEVAQNRLDMIDERVAAFGKWKAALDALDTIAEMDGQYDVIYDAFSAFLKAGNEFFKLCPHGVIVDENNTLILLHTLEDNDLIAEITDSKAGNGNRNGSSDPQKQELETKTEGSLKDKDGKIQGDTSVSTSVKSIISGPFAEEAKKLEAGTRSGKPRKSKSVAAKEKTGVRVYGLNYRLFTWLCGELATYRHNLMDEDVAKIVKASRDKPAAVLASMVDKDDVANQKAHAERIIFEKRSALALSIGRKFCTEANQKALDKISAGEKKMLTDGQHPPALTFVPFQEYVNETQRIEERLDLLQTFKEKLENYGKLTPSRELKLHALGVREQLKAPFFARDDPLPPYDKSDRKTIALVYMDGNIMDESIAPVRKALKEADRDPEVKSIVLRVSSRGGSSVASESLHRAVQQVSKPLVISFGKVAASGGYYIAAGRKIYAKPGTVTGSIGVLMVKQNIKGLAEKLGISEDNIGTALKSAYFSSSGAFLEWSEELQKQIDQMIDLNYDLFVSRVADGRKMSVEEVKAVAGGRVWCGVDAKVNNLVDEFGGLHDAIEEAKRLADIPVDIGASVRVFPKRMNLIELLLSSEEENEDLFKREALHESKTEYSIGQNLALSAWMELIYKAVDWEILPDRLWISPIPLEIDRSSVAALLMSIGKSLLAQQMIEQTRVPELRTELLTSVDDI